MSIKDCNGYYERLLSDIERGVTRYSAPRAVDRLKERIQRFDVECNSNEAKILYAYLRHEFGLQPVPETVTQLRSTLSARLRPTAEIDALHLLSRLTLHSETLLENFSLRKRASKIAHDNRLHGQEFRVLTNWVFALIECGNFEEARKLLPQAEVARFRVSAKELQRPDIDRAVSRLLAHKAKLLLDEVSQATEYSAAEILVSEARRLYDEAISRDSELDHRRVNQQAEFAEHLVIASERGTFSFLDLSEEYLWQAQFSLDAHNCALCRAYFHEVSSRLHLVRGNALLNQSPQDALLSWKRAEEEAAKSLEIFEAMKHGEARIPREILESARGNLIMAQQPQKVFLSHAGVDKELVREFQRTLQELNYDPWLDEEAMTAGEQLERAIERGFRDSCAAVFFVTKNFRDEGFLATEVNYAIAQARAKGDKFKIITLVFPGQKGKDPEIPAILRPYVWKNVKDPLHAFRELIRALPISPGHPTWPALSKRV